LFIGVVLMEFTVKHGDEYAEKTPALAQFFFEGAFTGKHFELLDGKLKGALKRARESKEFSGKEGEMIEIDSLGNLPASKVFLVGLGKEEKLCRECVRKAFGRLANAVPACGATHLIARLPVKKGKEGKYARAAAEALELASYEFNKYKNNPVGKAETKKEDKKKLETVSFFVEKDFEKHALDGARAGKIIGDATNFARVIANEPPNVATPEFVANEAKKVCDGLKLKCTVFDKKEIEKRGMHALLAVNGGSSREPRFVVMEYWGGGNEKPFAVVGKGVTFDSGGISIKPAGDMDKMKFDKVGACSTIGIMKAAAELKLKVNLVGVIALTENVLGGGGYKPGDIIMQKQKTIEVLNTDAEGRVILSDALTYAIEEFKPQVVMDLATLTGACVVALGDIAAGLFSNNDELAQKLYEAGMESGEWVWRLPVWKEYDEKNKSDVADIKNIGEAGGVAGAITAACFLKAFVGETKWAHFDIAGTGWNTRPKPYLGLGGTGAGVRVITEYLIGQAKK